MNEQTIKGIIGALKEGGLTYAEALDSMENMQIQSSKVKFVIHTAIERHYGRSGEHD